MLGSNLRVEQPFYEKLIVTLMITLIFAQLSFAQDLLGNEIDENLDQKKLKRIENWIGSPVGTQRSPWFVCVRMQGSSLVYKAKVYAIQARYQSWTAEWHRFRPQPYPSDDGVGLVTTKELAQLYINIQDLAMQGKLQHQVQTQAPPCGAELYENILHTKGKNKSNSEKTKHKQSSELATKKKFKNRSKQQFELRLDLWLLKQHTNKTTGEAWQHWQFFDPHLSLDQHPQLMIQQVVDLITKVAPEGVDSDRLIQTQDSGTLLLTVTAPSKVWLNGVYHGLWPSSRPIYLATDDYRVHVVPMDQNLSPITFEGLELSAGVKTKFKVEVE